MSAPESTPDHSARLPLLGGVSGPEPAGTPPIGPQTAPNRPNGPNRPSSPVTPVSQRLPSALDTRTTRSGTIKSDLSSPATPNPATPTLVRSQQKHLPLLGNPMLNALFNNPLHGHFQSILSVLAARPADYVLLVPETKFLLLAIDQDSGQPYKDLCTTTEFLQSHIINISVKAATLAATQGPGSNTISAAAAVAASSSSSSSSSSTSGSAALKAKQLRNFPTLSRRILTIRKNLVSNVKGFKHDFSIKISRQAVFKSFANYLPFGTTFHVAYLEEALTGNPVWRGLSRHAPVLLPSAMESAQAKPARVVDSKGSVVAFDLILSQFPQLAAKLAPHFQKLFQSFNADSCQSTDELVRQFTLSVAQATAIVNSVTSEALLRKIHDKFPGADLKESLYDYIQHNLYDKIWPVFVKLLSGHSDIDKSINSLYPTLQCLSLNQVGLPDPLLSSPTKRRSIEVHILEAIGHLKKLSVSPTSRAKLETINTTFKTLTGADDTLDADSLISQATLVVARAAVQNVNAHLEFTKLFAYSEDELETGSQGYVLASFEAVVQYINDPESAGKLQEYSSANAEFLSLLKGVSSDSNEENSVNDSSNDGKILKKIKKRLAKFEDGDIASDSFIRSRTLQGESILMVGLLQENAELLECLLKFINIFTLDDILEDVTVDGTTLLSAALQLKHGATEYIADAILQGTTEEITAYSNTLDDRGRNLGHYLFHCAGLIPLFGPYVDWRAKDVGGKTPFFAIVRCYDHSNYDKLVADTIDAVAGWYRSHGLRFNDLDHVDNRGNTLVHAIKNGKNLSLFLDRFAGLNLNSLNDSEQTPLSQFIRYNRLSNVEAIIEDDRLDLWRCDPKYHLVAQDYVKVDRIEDQQDPNEINNRKIMSLLDRECSLRYGSKSGDTIIYCMRTKNGPNNELCIYINWYNEGNNEGGFVVHTYADFCKFIRLLKMWYPNTYLGDGGLWLPEFGIVGYANVNYSRKFRLDRLLLNANMLMRAVALNPTTRGSVITQDFITMQQPIHEMEYLKTMKQGKASARQDILERPAKSYLLRPEDIGSYKSFLRFSNAELIKLNRAIERLYRGIVFLGLKYNDLDYITDNFVYLVANDGTASGLNKQLDCIPKEVLLGMTEDSARQHEVIPSFNKESFEESLKFVGASVKELSIQITAFVDSKIGSWWQIYGEIKEVGQQLAGIVRAEAAVGKSSEGTAVENIIGEIDELLGSNLKDSSKSGTVSATVASADGAITSLFESNGGYFSGVIEKRRKENANKLIEQFKKLKNRMVLLNIELKSDYEQLCTELANLYEFRERYLRQAFRELAEGKLRALRLQKEMAENSAQSFST